MKNKSGEVVDWNRTPGKPSFNAQNHQQNQQGWNEPIDMWGNANILSARANKPWTNETQPTLNPFQNHNSWNNNNQQINGSFPINQVPVNNAPLWGSTSSNINHSAMRPIRGPQPNQTQQNMPVMDGRNRQFSGWGLEIDSKPEDNFNSIEAVGQNLISSACSIASYTSIRNSKDPSKPESSLSVLNEMLNGLIRENEGKDQTELEELIKAIINVNDAWGQRAVDQSTSWDISSINYDDVITGPSSNTNQTGGNNQGSTTSLNPSATGHISTQSQQQQSASQQQQRRIKPMSHAISTSNSVDSNVWQNEPPTGTGIWEAHYESLGEKNLEWSSAASVSTQRQLPPSAQHPSPQIASQVTQQQQQQQQPSAKTSAIGRPMSFSTTSRQSNLGFRNQPPNPDSSSWNYLNSTSLWASNQSNMVHNELLNQQQQSQSGGRPINKGSSSNPRSNPPWPPTTNHPPPHNSDVFLGQPVGGSGGGSGPNPATVWSSTQLNPNAMVDNNRKFPSSNPQVPGNGPSSMMLPQDYQNMMQRPPPPATSSQSAGKANRQPNNNKSSLPQQSSNNNVTTNGPSSMQQSGFFRANVLRQLINLGFSEEEVQNSMVENNMDIERTLNDLRNKSAHIGLDALLNPIMGSNLFSSNSVSPPVVSNHYNSSEHQDPFKKVNGISPTDPTGPSGANTSASASTSFSALQLREQNIMKNIIHWNQKFSEISMKISQLMTMPSTNPLPVKELTQLREQSIQQIHVFQIQLKSVRNQMAMLQQRDVELSDRLSEMRLVNNTSASGGGPFSSNNWGSGDGGFGGWNNPPVSMHGGDEFFDQTSHHHHQSHGATNLAPGADRRWNNETVNSNTNQGSATPSTTTSGQQQKNLWPSSSFNNNKDDKPILTRHIIIRDLPGHITFDMIKMTIVSALSTGSLDQQQQLNEDFELNPNMASKWCLVSLASPLEAAHLMNQIGETGCDGAKGLGHPEFISEEATMGYLEEIKNLSTFGDHQQQEKNHHHDQEGGNQQTDCSASPPNSPSS